MAHRGSITLYRNLLKAQRIAFAHDQQALQRMNSLLDQSPWPGLLTDFQLDFHLYLHMETSSCPAVARQKTRSEFEKNGGVTDEKKISEVSEGSGFFPISNSETDSSSSSTSFLFPPREQLIDIGQQVSKLLVSNVVQTRPTGRGTQGLRVFWPVCQLTRLTSPPLLAAPLSPPWQRPSLTPSVMRLTPVPEAGSQFSPQSRRKLPNRRMIISIARTVAVGPRISPNRVRE